jgi:hypothetical protein
MRMVRQMPAPGQGRVPMAGGGTCRRRGGGAGADIPSVTKNDTAGEVVFKTASMLKHQIFNSSPNMSRAYFRLRHQ